MKMIEVMQLNDNSDIGDRCLFSLSRKRQDFLPKPVFYQSILVKQISSYGIIVVAKK